VSQRLIRIATRKSPLALWQANHVAKLIRQNNPEITTELVKMSTQGDKILDSPLAKIGGKGLFVKELEQGLIDGLADIAVHSMKDVPVEFPPGLGLVAILERHDPRDAFVSNRFSNLGELPSDVKIGTSSLRRQCQINENFPTAEILSLRGNVNTRLKKLDEGDYDAIILATAGLERLGFASRIRQRLPVDVSLPAIGQGAIGIESRKEDEKVLGAIAKLNDAETAICVRAERAMNERLQGGCQVPIAGFAEISSEGELTLKGLVGSPDGRKMLRATVNGSADDAETLGQGLADDLLSRGADRILKALYRS